jgi:hypothetical protein
MQRRRRSVQTIRPARILSQSSVFLNIPYDSHFERLYLAYIAGICAFGLLPRAVIEIPGGQRRLDRILELIRCCRYSIHDLSRVELDRRSPCTPRFNMPFELGLAVVLSEISDFPHEWFVYEAHDYRLQKSLSDVNGTDAYIHGGRVEGVLGKLCSVFLRANRQPTVPQMRRIYRMLRRELPRLVHDAGAVSPFDARVFRDLCVLASAAANILVK